MTIIFSIYELTLRDVAQINGQHWPENYTKIVHLEYTCSWSDSNKWMSAGGAFIF